MRQALHTSYRLRAAIEEGYTGSMTFRSLVDHLEASDVILHIERGDCACDCARACLGSVSSTGDVRPASWGRTQAELSAALAAAG